MVDEESSDTLGCLKSFRRSALLALYRDHDVSIKLADNPTLVGYPALCESFRIVAYDDHKNHLDTSASSNH